MELQQMTAQYTSASAVWEVRVTWIHESNRNKLNDPFQIFHAQATRSEIQHNLQTQTQKTALLEARQHEVEDQLKSSTSQYQTLFAENQALQLATSASREAELELVDSNQKLQREQEKLVYEVTELKNYMTIFKERSDTKV
jgi:hypothetical protein